MIEAFILACAIGGLISWAAWYFTRHFAERSWWLLTLAGVLVLAFSRLIVFPGLKNRFANNWPLVYAIIAATIFGCVVQLYRFSRNRKHSLPVATILIIGTTALVTGLQFVFPEVLTEFRRNREALLAGEWWRMVTPLFVQWAGWPHACANGVAAVFLCPLAERFYGKRLFLHTSGFRMVRDHPSDSPECWEVYLHSPFPIVRKSPGRQLCFRLLAPPVGLLCALIETLMVRRFLLDFC
jgi:hypothetical protein